MRILRLVPLTLRLPLLVSIVMLACFVVFGHIGARSAREAESRADGWALHSARVTAERLDTFLRHAKTDVERIAAWPGVASTLQRLQTDRRNILPPWKTLRDLSVLMPHLEGMFVIGRDGTVMWSNPPGLGLLGTDMSDHPALEEAAARQDGYVSNLIADGFWHEPYVFVAAAVRDEEGEVVAVVVAVLATHRLGSALASHDLAEEHLTHSMYVLDAANNLIVVAADEGARAVPAPAGSMDVALLDQVRASRAGKIVLMKGGGRAITARTPGSVPWAVVIRDSGNELGLEAREIYWKYTLAAVLLAAIILAITFPFAKSMLDPLRALTADARRLAKGDLSRHIPSPGRDEISTLAESFESMRVRPAESRGRSEAVVSRLNEMNQLKDEFVANLSHEFRTPMHVMRGYLDMLLDGSLGDPTDDARGVLLAIRKSHDGLWEIISACLDLAKIDAGAEVVLDASFDVRDVVREIMGEFTNELENRRLGGWIRLPQDACPITSDRVKVKSILRNLVANAVKYTEQGEVEVLVAEDPGNDTVTASVRDTGIGIAKEHQQQIFERFRQLDGSMKRSHGGVGLGLSIVQETATLLGGGVSVTSNVGEGSAFSFTLPRGRPVRPHDAADPATGEEERGYCI